MLYTNIQQNNLGSFKEDDNVKKNKTINDATHNI